MPVQKKNGELGEVVSIPFESKDVKSTYKRILANNFTFPDHTVVSPYAKSLIRSILQNNPDHRPTLDSILNDDFFVAMDIVSLSKIPPSALREVPTIPPVSADTTTANPSVKVVNTGNEKIQVREDVATNDENVNPQNRARQGGPSGFKTINRRCYCTSGMILYVTIGICIFNVIRVTCSTRGSTRTRQCSSIFFTSSFAINTLS